VSDDAAVPRPSHMPWVTGDVHLEEGDVFVHLAGELDVAAHQQVVRLCTSVPGADVHVDISEVTFMDSAGHDALVVAQQQVEASGGTLELVGVAGEPARVIAVLDRVADAD
jgi:anti-anti-sigma factor